MTENSIKQPDQISPAVSRPHSDADQATIAASAGEGEIGNLDIEQQNRRASHCTSATNDDDDQDRIKGWQDIRQALMLTWTRQKKHLFITWLHVPIGVTLLLVISWGLRLAINQAPFRFPAPVIAMMIFFALLLILEWFSIKFPHHPPSDADADKDVELGKTESHRQPTAATAKTRKPKRFVDPVMLVLAPPCEFLLRNMSVMFTPSFILIPAREVINGKEIGLLAAWFTASQVLAFVLPVWFNLAITKAQDAYKARYGKHARDSAKDKRQRRQSATASAIHSRRGSVATLAGVEYEKRMGFNGGSRLGAVATGLSGLTAHVIAPVTHVRTEIDEDVRRQIESTVLEYARQQGDPAVNDQHKKLKFDSYRPVSDVSTFHHPHGHHHLHGSSSVRNSSRRSRSARSRERSLSPNRAKHSRSHDVSMQKKSAKRPTLRETASVDANVQHKSSKENFATLASPDLDNVPDFNYDDARASRSTDIRPLSLPVLPAPAAMSDSSEYRFPDIEATAGLYPTERQPEIQTPLHRDLTLTNEESISGQQTVVHSRRPSLMIMDGAEEKRKIGFKLEPHPSRRDSPIGSSPITPNDCNTPGQVAGESDDEEEEEEPSAVERLASWFGDLITPCVYAILFIIGIPLFFLKDIALPLFLAINLLTFIAAITIVPPKIRRFLHPILSTSFATVMIIWAFAAMKGIGLKTCLNRFYSVDARYSVLWSLDGYKGPVPGAGDVLFSTLDAGIVALAVPMYRYRKELWDNLTRMLIVLIPCAGLSLFFWNWIARLIGMDETRSLAFTARFMSTPLAIELANNVGADESITVILVVITGVVAAIFKEQFFYRLMRVSKDDYLTVGLTMGATSGAIGASSLLSTPRTMAIASLGFVLFGTILLVATAIPAVVDVVQSLAGSG